MSKRTHGQAGTKLYQRWVSMKQRCRNPNNKCYKHYGGRGIKVCDEWNNSFESFFKWAHESGYDESLTLERIDNNGNYEPSNCKWVSMEEQSNNRRSSHYLQYNGQKMTISQWSKHTKINENVIYDRLNNNWPIGEVLGFEPHSYPRHYELGKYKHTLKKATQAKSGNTEGCL